jgi:acetyl esterase/lipase
MWRGKIRKKRENLKNSVFIVNKLYLLVLFLILALSDWALAIYSIISYLIVYIIHVFSTRLPIENKGSFKYITKVYKQLEDGELKMDIWYPNHINTAYPLVLFAHGGGWISGFRNQPNNISWCKYLAANGFAAASIDYRFGIRNSMKDILADYDDALNYIKRHANELKICDNNIILMGLSAGGHLSLLYASFYSYKQDKKRMGGISGVVAYYAPSDLSDLLSEESRSLFARFATVKTLKGKPEDQEDYEYYSPVQWVSKNMPPVLVVHGKHDRIVPFSSTAKLIAKFDEYGVLYKLLIHPSGDHCFEMKSKDLQTIRILRGTISWMKERSKKE